MFIRFDRMYERDRHMDRQTDRQTPHDDRPRLHSIARQKPRLRAEWVVVKEHSCILELLFKSNKKKFSFRRVDRKKIGSHPERDLLQSVL